MEYYFVSCPGIPLKNPLEIQENNGQNLNLICDFTTKVSNPLFTKKLSKRKTPLIAHIEKCELLPPFYGEILPYCEKSICIPRVFD